MAAFRIGCLAWGSLVWDPRTLPRAGDFRDDGPRLPIEFSRVALDGRVTLVIDPMAREVQSHWVRLAVQSLEEAVHELAIREKIPANMRSRWVGRLIERDRTLDPANTNTSVRSTIAAWLDRQPLDAVVWTALPLRGPDGDEARPDFDRLLGHLKSLDGEARDRAEEYIRRTPDSIGTAHRKRFEELLGWVSTKEGD